MNKLSIEEVIQEAQKDGRFSNLPGKGRPLRLDPSPDAVINGLLKEANVKPEWVELAQEIDGLENKANELLAAYEQQHHTEYSVLMANTAAPDGEPRTFWRNLWLSVLNGHRSTPGRSTPELKNLESFLQRWHYTLGRYAVLLHEANRKIRRYNYLAPGLGRQRALIDVKARLDEFAVRLPILQNSNDGVAPTCGVVPASLLTPPEEQSSASLPRDLQAGRILQHVDRSKRRKRCQM